MRIKACTRTVLALLTVVTTVAVAAPRNDECSDAITIRSTPFRDVVDLRADVRDDDRSDSQCDRDQDYENSSWYRYTATRAISLDVDTFDSVDAGVRGTRITAYRGSCGACEPFLENERADDFDDNTKLSRLVVSLAPGESMLFQIVGLQRPRKTTVVVREHPTLRVVGAQYGGMSDPAIATDPTGEFLVVWSEGGETIRARRYDEGGVPLQDSTIEGMQGAERVRVARAGNGEFVVAWADGLGVRARRFRDSGVPFGTEIVVSSDTAAYQRQSDVAAGADGSFAVVWTVGQSDGVRGRLFDSAGTPLGDAFVIDGDGAGGASVGMASDRSFVVAWTRYDSVAFSSRAFMQRFDAYGTAQGDQVELGVYGSGPTVKVDAKDRIVAAWRSSYATIAAQRFDAQGGAMGPPFTVNEDVNEDVGQPELGFRRDGDFVVAWADLYSGVMARHFDGEGTPAGPQLQVSRWETPSLSVSVSSGEQGTNVAWTGYDGVWVRSRPEDAVPICTSPPREGCWRSGNGSLIIADSVNDADDRLTWKWRTEDSVSGIKFGDPRNGASFVVCLYEDAYGTQSGSPVWRANLPGGSRCGDKPCWTSNSNGFWYADATALSDGVSSFAFEQKNGRIALRAKGVRLPERVYGDDLLPLSEPLLVQLVANNGACVESHYETRINKSSHAKFAAHSDAP